MTLKGQDHDLHTLGSKYLENSNHLLNKCIQIANWHAVVGLGSTPHLLDKVAQ